MLLFSCASSLCLPSPLFVSSFFGGLEGVESFHNLPPWVTVTYPTLFQILPRLSGIRQLEYEP